MKRGPLNKLIKGEKGQALLLVMLMILVGGLIVTPMLGNMSTGLKIGKEVYEESMYLSYAADSGVEDALWQVKNKQLPNLFSDYNQYAYYDYSPSYEWQYNLEDEYDEVGIVNGKDVNATFQNVWVPKDISAPSLSEAESIAQEGRLAVFGSMSGASATEYQIKIYYYYNDQNPAQPDYDLYGTNLRVQKIGIWLPPGFHYVEGTSNLTGACAPSSEEADPYKSGEAVVWNFSSSPQLSVFPSGSSSVNPMVRKVTFQFTGPEGQAPGTALSWITSTGVSGISYSWDASVKVYKITSVASDDTGKETTVDAYAATTDMLKRGAAIAGDYCAIGGTLMTQTTDYRYRDRLFKESSATVQSTDPQASFYIPANAHLDLAYLYWTGWLENAGIWGDSCSDFDNWTYQTSTSYPYSNWSISSGRFRGHAYFTGDTYRTLTMTSAVDLHYYAGQTVRISWQQSEGGNLEASDGLDFSFSSDGGVTWSAPLNPPNGAFRGNNPPSNFTYTIPSQYLTSAFKMRFYLADCGGSNEYVYIDNISISLTGSPVENARVNQVRFNGYKITADPTRTQTQPTGSSLSYSCFYDATSLVFGMINNKVLGSNGSGIYTVGHVLDWPGSYQMYNYPSGTLDGTTAFPLGTPAYKVSGQWVSNTQLSHAAWSLVIVYSSPETQGHQLYLYDDFAYAADSVILDFDFDGSPGGTIGGFIAPEAIKDEDHAARLTVFIGEGDDWIGGDDYWYGPEYIAVNGTELWDGMYSVRIPGSNTLSAPYNPWNEMSTGLVASGIDIDTFTVTYPTVKPGDISAQIDLRTGTDNWNLVYIILSFRSELVPAGTFSYLVR